MRARPMSCRRLVWAAALSLALAGCGAPDAPAGDGNTAVGTTEPLEVRAVVVTMFEIGELGGDEPGEFQLWKEREGLDTVYPMPAAYSDVHADPERGLIAVITGIGTANAVSTITTLGMDPRFDLSNAYWIVAGISGGDPADTSLGSAVWADHLVDGDLAYELDAREIPESWPTGYVPLRASEPYETPKPEENMAENQHFRLDAGLVDWAYALTKDVAIPDDEAMAAFRERFDQEAARQPPRVMRGDHLAAMTFWHGPLLNDWANDWVAYWSGGEGEFVTSAMEDTGTALALSRLGEAGLVDPQRLLVLRTVSNFTLGPPGVDAAESLAGEQAGYSGMRSALEAAHGVGSRVVEALVDDWDRYRDALPEAGGSVDD